MGVCKPLRARRPLGRCPSSLLTAVRSFSTLASTPSLRYPSVSRRITLAEVAFHAPAIVVPRPALFASSAFFDQRAKARTTAAIRAVESVTAAEVVVVVRPRSARYWLTSIVVAAACALTALAVMWFSPTVYDVHTMPLDTALVFIVALLASHFSDSLKTRLTPQRRRQEATSNAAKRCFDELGIARTRDRTGMLVYVSVAERALEVLTDEGLDPKLLGEAWEASLSRLRDAVRHANIGAFVDALESLAPPLEQLLPRQADDLNELSDEVA